jgi:hypothetical protein
MHQIRKRDILQLRHHEVTILKFSFFQCDWAEKNCEGDFSFGVTSGAANEFRSYTFYFTDEKDAVMFKLVHG